MRPRVPQPRADHDTRDRTAGHARLRSSRDLPPAHLEAGERSTPQRVGPPACLLALGIAAVVATAPHRRTIDGLYPLHDPGGRQIDYEDWNPRTPWIFYSPILWLVSVGALAPVMGRVLGQVGALAALPSEARPLPHLPPMLARLVHEAAAIRDELDLHGLDAVLERAWILTCEFDQLPAGLRIGLDRSHAALDPVRALIELRAQPGRTRVAESQHCARLAAALAEFEASLAEPASVGFR